MRNCILLIKSIFLCLLHSTKISRIFPVNLRLAWVTRWLWMDCSKLMLWRGRHTPETSLLFFTQRCQNTLRHTGHKHCEIWEHPHCLHSVPSINAYTVTDRWLKLDLFPYNLIQWNGECVLITRVEENEFKLASWHGTLNQTYSSPSCRSRGLTIYWGVSIAWISWWYW